MKIWFDFVNVPHAHFLSVIKKYLSGKHDTFCTARDFAQLRGLLIQKNIEFKIIGRHYHGRLFKLLGSFQRCLNLGRQIADFDVSISCGSYEAVLFSKMKGKKTVVFDDNDISPNWLYAVFTDYFICPDKFDLEKISRQGIKRQNIYTYCGYKEDIYLADYAPDADFLKRLPFKEYVVVRPENLSATYIEQRNRKTIAPDLLALLEETENIVFLPRYSHEAKYAQGLKNVYLPPKALNGPDLCFYSKAVFTGAGTLAREAACLGVPAISFFPGENLLAVDKEMVSKNWIFHSRNTQDIIKYFRESKKREFDINRCKESQKQVFEILDKIIEKKANKIL